MRNPSELLMYVLFVGYFMLVLYAVTVPLHGNRVRSPRAKDDANK